VLRYAAESTADPDAAWALLARPSRWQEWAPHLRGAWRLGEPEVRPGARGAARLLGVVPVPAVVTRSTRTAGGRSWTWRVGPVELDHEVSPRRAGGCTVATTIRAPAVLEPALAVTYGPLVGLLMRNLARVAAAA
jgi:polyketide cyclase/dehydrase/lipid transport protein